MAVQMPPLDAGQLAAQAAVVTGIAERDLERTSQVLRELEHRRVWLSPPLLGIAAVEILLIASRSPTLWRIDDDLWGQYLPDRRPSGKYQWRHANYALHAAGCLAGGLWLDVASQESYWRMPLWPFVLDLVELLALLAEAQFSTTPAEFARSIADLLAQAVQPSVPSGAPAPPP